MVNGVYMMWNGIMTLIYFNFMYMTKDEAILSMRNGKKVRHDYFSDGEWITMLGNIIRMEQGQECWSSEFWKYREGTGWETGWSIVNE